MLNWRVTDSFKRPMNGDVRFDVMFDVTTGAPIMKEKVTLNKRITNHYIHIN